MIQKLTMNKNIPFFIFFFILIFLSCNKHQINELQLSDDELFFRNDSCYKKNDSTLFSGKYVAYYPDSILHKEAYYKNGLLHGKSTTWFEDGTPMETDEFAHGKRNGILCLWCDCGYKYMEISYKDDIQHGKSLRFAWNGTVILEENFEQGVIDGKRTEYYEDGQLKADELYQNGLRTGVWKYYSPQGELTVIQRYESDSLISEEK